jgi:tetratricopeptide (TPR) repeat protein
MLGETAAIIVGVSRYESARFAPLGAAEADARRVTQALTSWGFRSENIRLLLGKNATRRAVLEAVRVWPLQKFSRVRRLLFFFAGHGARLRDPQGISVSAIMTWDANPSDRIGTGILLADLLGAVARVGPHEAFIFLDACDLRLDSVLNVVSEKVADADILQAPRRGKLFCMFAAGAEKAFESERSGYFTDALLRAASELRQSSPSCSALASRVEKELASAGRQLPEIYQIGAADSWFLPEAGQQLPEKPESLAPPIEVIVRRSLHGELQDQLIRYPNCPVYLWGEPGSGKTTIIRDLAHDANLGVYWSAKAPAALLEQGTLAAVAAALVAQIPSVFPAGRAPAIPTDTFHDVATGAPGLLLVIDDAEKLAVSELEALVHELSRNKIQTVILSQIPPLGLLAEMKNAGSLRELRCKNLSTQEIEAFKDAFGGAVSLSAAELLLHTKGNARKVRELIHSAEGGVHRSSAAFQSRSLAAEAVWFSKGYISEGLFSAHFQLTISDLHSLIDLGLVSFTNGLFTPHEALQGLCSDKPPELSAITAYWAAEVLAGPGSEHAWRALLAAFACSGWSADLDEALRIAVGQAFRLRAWALLESLVPHFAPFTSHSEAALVLAERLIWLGKYESAAALLSSDVCSSRARPEHRHWAIALESERLWWLGLYKDSEALAELVLQDATAPLARDLARLSLGICSFFLGDWHASIRRLQPLADRSESARCQGWARSVLGTVNALRGVDVEGGKQQIESAIRLLTAAGDDLGVASALGNLAEVNWKSGELNLAYSQLCRAKKIATDCGNNLMLTEMNRNLLHVLLRTFGPHCFELEEILDELRAGFAAGTTAMEDMQLWNTLATVAAYRGDSREVERCLSFARPLTEGNPEYDIYTWGNEALLATLVGDRDLASERALKAIQLARIGNNILAEKQVLRDLETVAKLPRKR